MASGVQKDTRIIGFLTIDSSPFFLTWNSEWLTEASVIHGTGKRNLYFCLAMDSPLPWVSQPLWVH